MEVTLKQATSHHVVPDTHCVRVTAYSPSPPQARRHLQVRRARLYGGSETDVPSALLLLTYTKTHTCVHTCWRQFRTGTRTQPE